MYMSNSSIRITFTLALLTGLLMGFQNCTLSRFSGGTDTAATSTPTTGGFDGNNPGTSGGNLNAGGGFDGKAFLHVGQCLGKAAVDTVVLVDVNGSTANVVRSKCVDQPLPYPNRISDLDVTGMAIGAAVVVADDMVLFEDRELPVDASGQTLIPQTWTIPAKFPAAQIFCEPNTPKTATPMFTLYSLDGKSFFGDIQFPAGVFPNGVPSTGVYTSPLASTVQGAAYINLNLAEGVPFAQKLSTNVADYASLDNNYDFLVYGGFRFSYRDLTNAGNFTSVTNLNCYSSLPGWSTYMANYNKPAAPAGGTAVGKSQDGGNDGGRNAYTNGYYSSNGGK
jgi:hypothetical protein